MTRVQQKQQQAKSKWDNNKYKANKKQEITKRTSKTG
jgi:hypothetical protein